MKRKAIIKKPIIAECMKNEGFVASKGEAIREYINKIPKKSSVILCKALRNEINRISRQNNVKKHKDFEEREERE